MERDEVLKRIERAESWLQATADKLDRIERGRELDRQWDRLEWWGRAAVFVQGFGFGLVLIAFIWKLAGG